MLLSVVASQIAAAGRTETALASNLRLQAAVENAADGSIYQALFHLLAEGAQHWATPGTYRVTVGDVAITLSLEDLAGRVNPNTATPALMGALLEAVGIAAPQAIALGEAVVAWRTPEPASAARNSAIRGRPFDSLDELGAVPGMTPELLARIAPDLTLWWENDPEPAAAPPDVLRALRVLGDTRSPSATRRPLQAVAITATAIGPRGGRFTRHAAIVLNAASPRSRWRIVAWGT